MLPPKGPLNPFVSTLKYVRVVFMQYNLMLVSINFACAGCAHCAPSSSPCLYVQTPPQRGHYFTEASRTLLPYGTVARLPVMTSVEIFCKLRAPDALHQALLRNCPSFLVRRRQTLSCAFPHPRMAVTSQHRSCYSLSNFCGIGAPLSRFTLSMSGSGIPSTSVLIFQCPCIVARSAEMHCSECVGPTSTTERSWVCTEHLPAGVGLPERKSWKTRLGQVPCWGFVNFRAQRWSAARHRTCFMITTKKG